MVAWICALGPSAQQQVDTVHLVTAVRARVRVCEHDVCVVVCVCGGSWGGRLLLTTTPLITVGKYVGQYVEF